MRSINRRKFFSNTSKVLASAGLLSLASCASAQPTAMRNIFIHHVFFWLKDPNNLEHKAQLLAALHKLATVETIQQTHIGIPAATNRPVIDTTYAFSMMSIFKNKADQDTYQTHPTHLEFVEKNQHLWDKVVVYDTIDAN